MTPWTWLLQAEDVDWRSLLFVLFFVVVSLLGRLAKWLQERGGSRDRAEREDPREALRRRRAERRAAEAEGGSLWERLERGDVLEVPPPRVEPEPARAPPRAPARELVLEGESLEGQSLEWAPERPPAEATGSPAALSVLGEVSEPSEAPERSLETAPAVPLAELFASAPSHDARRPASRARRLAAGADWRRAIVLAEALGPPVSERRPA